MVHLFSKVLQIDEIQVKKASVYRALCTEMEKQIKSSSALTAVAKQVTTVHGSDLTGRNIIKANIALHHR